MNQTRDRCGPAVPAACRVTRQGELYLRRHCTTRLSAALSEQGGAIWPTGQPLTFIPRIARSAMWPMSTGAAAAAR
jgi:hypothetical protein